MWLKAEGQGSFLGHVALPNFWRNHKNCCAVMPACSFFVFCVAALGVVEGELVTNEDATFIQLGGQFSYLQDDCDSYDTPMWNSKRDLANISHSFISLDSSLSLHLWSAVPHFGPQASYMALIASIQGAGSPSENETLQLQRFLEKTSLFCTGANGSHPEKLRLASSKHILILQCDWPKAESGLGKHHIWLAHANGTVVGEVNASHEPSLLKQYRTMACVRNLWNNPVLNVSGLLVFPQWLDFHYIHGIDHFIVYTTSDMSEALPELYQPYIDAGLVTRVHLNLPAERCWPSQSSPLALRQIISNDCLYRAKGHAKWLIPSLDVDEYLQVRLLDHDVTGMLEAASRSFRAPSQRVAGVAFERYRFARAPSGHVEIASPRYCNLSEPTLKYAVKPDLTDDVDISVSAGLKGVVYDFDKRFAVINHYRHPKSHEIRQHQIANSTDESLLQDVPSLEMAMQKRYGNLWRRFLETMKQAPEPPCRNDPKQGRHPLRSEIMEPLELRQLS